MAAATATATILPLPSPSSPRRRSSIYTSSSSSSSSFSSSLSPLHSSLPSTKLLLKNRGFAVASCLPSTPKSGTPVSTKLFVSGLSFRTTEESLRNAFQNFGQLVEVRYATKEESQRAIEGMHGKFLDGRVIFVEVAKPRSELPQGSKQTPKQY